MTASGLTVTLVSVGADRVVVVVSCGNGERRIIEVDGTLARKLAAFIAAAEMTALSAGPAASEARPTGCVAAQVARRSPA
jgi:hypothetical protein